MKKPSLRYIILFISLVLMMSGVAISSLVQNNFGQVIVTEVDLLAADGSNIHSTLQKPYYADAGNPLPAVIVIHGSMQSKEWLMAFGIELARRGFVVLTIDVNGHGNSDDGTGSGIAALDYITNLDYVDESQIGLIGHSMGGGIAMSAIINSDTPVRALVLVGSGVSSSIANSSYPQNLLIAVGSFDSLSRYSNNLSSLEAIFGVTNIEPHVTYGNFTDGTARRIVFGPTNHLLETIEPTLVSESVEWMKSSLKGGMEDDRWVPADQLLYGWWLVGGLISTFFAVFTIFPVITILLDIPFFSQVKKQPISEHAADNSQFLGYGLLYGLVGVILFYPMLGVGLFIDFPQNWGSSVMAWILGTGLVLILLAWYLLKTEKVKLDWTEIWKTTYDSRRIKTVLVRTFILALLVIFWLYLWSWIVDIGFALDLRCFLPGMNDLTLSRALFVPLYTVFFFVYFFADGLWLTGVLRRKNMGSWMEGQIKWSAESVFIKCLPYVILIALEYGIGLLTGITLFPGLIGYSFLFFYAFLPWFAVSAVITVWGYRSTDNYYLGAFINALLCAWLLATILSF